MTYLVIGCAMCLLESSSMFVFLVEFIWSQTRVHLKATIYCFPVNTDLECEPVEYKCIQICYRPNFKKPFSNYVHVEKVPVGSVCVCTVERLYSDLHWDKKKIFKNAEKKYLSDGGVHFTQ